MNRFALRTPSIVFGALVMSLGWLVVGVALPAQAASDWSMVSAGSTHTCGIRVGKLYCWGQNNDGQLGFDNGGTTVQTPTQITAATDWKTVDAGGYDTCAIRSVGKLYCWGYNVFGQVGFNSEAANVVTPTKITSADDWKAVSSGGVHTCAIRSIGKLYCWGYNSYGQVGFNSAGHFVLTPTKITSADDWKTVTAGGNHTCAIRSVGKLYCWGNNSNDEVGFNNGGAAVLTPTQITAATDWKSVTGGAQHTCAIRTVGKLYCWGYNSSDEVGFNSGGANVPTPTKITTADDWTRVAAGGQHTCAIRSVGKLYCWGYNPYDQVGINTSGTNVPAPTKITSADDWKTVAGGDYHGCAIRSVGKLYCWGANGEGEVGFSSGGANVPTPTQVTTP